MSAIDATSEGIDGLVDDETARAWASAVHEWIRGQSGGGRLVGGVRVPGPGWNYYAVRVQLAGGSVLRLLLNAAIGLVAASDDEGVPEFGPLRFREVPSSEVFEVRGWRVATAAQLTAELREGDLSALPERQRKDVLYHRPTRVGDLLFNWFD
jgi:hypothetical protein